MAGNVTWAGSLAAQRARHECQMMAQQVSEELERRIRTQIDSLREFQRTIAEIFGQCAVTATVRRAAAHCCDLHLGIWLSSLSEDTKLRQTILKEESDLLVDRMQAAVDREIGRRYDVRKAKVAAERAYEAQLAEQHAAVQRATEQCERAEAERMRAEEARVRMAREVARSEEDRRKAEHQRQLLEQALQQSRAEAEQAREADRRAQAIQDAARQAGQLLEEKLNGRDVDEGILDA